MGSLRDEAKAYEPPKTLNIADLEAVSLDQPIEGREGIKKDGTTFKYKVMVIDGEDYRVPNSVLNTLKTLIEEKSKLKTIKVVKKGEGLNTEYTVIELE